MEPNYTYAGKVLRVIDGDTYLIDIDLGFHTHAHVRVRLDGVNCPERNTPEGREAQDFVRTWLSTRNNEVIIMTRKAQPQSFERYVAHVEFGSFDLGSLLIAQGFGHVV